MVPDKPVSIMQPPALVEAVNVRAIGPNLANAGGFTEVSGFPQEIGSLINYIQTLVRLRVADSVYDYVTVYWDNYKSEFEVKYTADPDVGPTYRPVATDIPDSDDEVLDPAAVVSIAKIEGLDRAYDDKDIMPVHGDLSNIPDRIRDYACVYNGRRGSNTGPQLYFLTDFAWGQFTFILPNGHLQGDIFIGRTHTTTDNLSRFTAVTVKVSSETLAFNADGTSVIGRILTAPPEVYSYDLLANGFGYLGQNIDLTDWHRINDRLLREFIVSDLHKKFALIVRDLDPANYGQYRALEWQIVNNQVVGPVVSDILTSNVVTYDLNDDKGGIVREQFTFIHDAGYDADGILQYVFIDTDCTVTYAQTDVQREVWHDYTLRMYGPGFDKTVNNTNYVIRPDLGVLDRNVAARNYKTMALVGSSFEASRFHIVTCDLDMGASTMLSYQGQSKDHNIRLDKLEPKFDDTALVTGTSKAERIENGNVTETGSAVLTEMLLQDFMDNLSFNSYEDDRLRSDMSRTTATVVQETVNAIEGDEVWAFGESMYMDPQGLDNSGLDRNGIVSDTHGAIIEYVPYPIHNDWVYDGGKVYYQYFAPDGTPYDMAPVYDTLWGGPPPTENSLHDTPFSVVALVYVAP